MAILGRAPTAPRDLLSLRIRELLAVCDFASGVAQLQAWRDLSSMAGIAASLGARGIGREALPLARDVKSALLAAWRSAGPMKLDAAVLDLVRELLAVHDTQRDTASRAEYERAMWPALRHNAWPREHQVSRGADYRGTVKEDSP